MKRLIAAVTVAASLAAAQVAQAAPPASGGKPMFQDNAQHTGVSPYAGPKRAGVLASFDTRQPGDARADIQSAPIVGPDGTVYIGNFRGTFTAVRPPTSGDKMQLVWQFRPPGMNSLHTTPAIDADGTVYLPFGEVAAPGQPQPQSPGGFLYALTTPAGGAAQPIVKWRFSLGGRSTSSPTIGPDGTIYQLAGSGALFAIDAAGNKKWSAKVGGVNVSTPALGKDGTVYTLGLDGKLYAVQPPAASGDGTVKWTFDFGALPGSTPNKADNRAFPGGGFDGKGAGDSPAIGPDGTIYFGASNANFYAVAPDGKMKWMFEAEREVAGIWSSPVIAPDGSTVYFGANAGGIYALDTATGKPRWQFPIYGSVYAAPELDKEGRLYVGATVGHVWALDSATGKAVWDWNAGEAVWTAPAITPDGALIVGTRDGQIWALADRSAAIGLPRTGGFDPATLGLTGTMLVGASFALRRRFAAPFPREKVG